MPAEQERDLGAARVDLDELLSAADVVSLHAALTPETHSFPRNRNGPEPIVSLICSVGDVWAMRSGMMKHCRAPSP